MVKMTPPHTKRVQQWARELFERPNFYIIDTETTGIGKQDEVVQIGIVDKHGAVVLNTLVKAHVPISPKASQVNGITDDMLQDAPPLSDLYVTLSSALAGRPLVAYNMPFDWRMLEQSFGKAGLPIFRSGPRHCAMRQYAQFRGQRNAYGNGYRWFSLSEACRQQRIQAVNTHTAVGDSLLTLELIKRMAD